MINRGLVPFIIRSLRGLENTGGGWIALHDCLRTPDSVLQAHISVKSSVSSRPASLTPSCSFASSVPERAAASELLSSASITGMMVRCAVNPVIQVRWNDLRPPCAPRLRWKLMGWKAACERDVTEVPVSALAWRFSNVS